MVYNVIGVMSGSSLDGLDMAYVEISETGGKWTFDLKHTLCYEYDDTWIDKLRHAHRLPIGEFLELHTAYGRYIGHKVNAFIDTHQLHHKIHLIASHGHTAYHNPEKNTSFQLGDGGSVSAITQLHVVSDLRNKDTALGGQGAPIVPVAEKYFWEEYDFCLNIGGIANVTVNRPDDLTAFDVCTANQVLNHYAGQEGMKYDAQGATAAAGTVDADSLSRLNSLEYFTLDGPKSLSNDFSLVYRQILDDLSPADALATMCEHIAIQVRNAVKPHMAHPSQRLLITGGGAHNDFLLSRIQYHLDDMEISTAEKDIIDYKEAIAMALIGVLRWREESNVLSSVTGAEKDSVGGALWVN